MRSLLLNRMKVVEAEAMEEVAEAAADLGAVGTEEAVIMEVEWALEWGVAVIVVVAKEAVMQIPRKIVNFITPIK